MNSIEKSNLQKMTCCFTGHREIPANELEGVQARLEETIKELYHRGVIYYGAGGARGFDCLAAETVLRLREQKEYANIKLILVLPCADQASKWNAKDIAKYEEIKSKADKTRCLSPKYTRTCMHERNRHLVNWSSVCVCYKTRDTGGTAYTVGYAEKNGLEIINVSQSQAA